jgi:hypothetical protein
MSKKRSADVGITEKQFDRIMESIPKQLRPVDVSKLLASIIYSYDMVEETPAILSYAVILLREAGVVIDPSTGTMTREKVQVH